MFSIDRELFVGEATSITLPAATGQIQILTHHTPLVSLLKEGDVVIESPGNKQTLPIASGVVQVKPHETVVLVNF